MCLSYEHTYLYFQGTKFLKIAYGLAIWFSSDFQYTLGTGFFVNWLANEMNCTGNDDLLLLVAKVQCNITAMCIKIPFTCMKIECVQSLIYFQGVIILWLSYLANFTPLAN